VNIKNFSKSVFARIGIVLIVITIILVAPLAVQVAYCSNVRFAAFGDYGSNNANEQAVADLVNSWNPDLIITTGDNSYDSTAFDDNVGQYYYDYIGDYTGTYGVGSPTNRFFPSLGNNDYTSSGAGLSTYLSYFTLPGTGIASSNTSGNERYYDFVWGPVHFFAIDSNPAGTDGAPGDGRSETSPQAVWLQAQLAASTSPWKIVYMHHAPYSSGDFHGTAENAVMQWPYEDWGATAVLAGHDHVYERIIRDDNSDGVDFAYFITGAGGGGLYGFTSPPETGSQVRYRDDYGSMLVEASDTSITFEFYSVSEGLIDTYTPDVPNSNEDFTIIAMPDTQHYTDNPNNYANFSAQTQWIVDNKDSRNIVFVTGLGDIVQNGNANLSEWQIADDAYSLLEDPLTTLLAQGIPYGLAVGNHDQSPEGGGSSASTSLFNQFFGVSRFTGRSYYGGHYGTDNDNNYELFSAGGMDFIIIHFEYDTTPEQAVLDWADGLLTTYGNRRAILTTHYMINAGNPGSWGTQGLAIYNALSDHPNLFLMLGGHMHGEGRRQDTAVNGNVVNTLLSDYQDYVNGGDGWLRIMTFSPANNTISVQTYSPTRNGGSGDFKTDADSQFTLFYDMGGSGGLDTTINFQDGIEPDYGYLGTLDTVLSQFDPTFYYDGDIALYVDGDDPDGSGNDLSTLLYWDISAIPAGSIIQEVSITLNVFGVSNDSYQVYEMKRDWVESETNWNLYSLTNGWEIPGALGAQDRGDLVLGSFSPTGTGMGIINLNSDGMALVQSWVDSPTSNHGFIIANSSATDGADFDSREASTASTRPKLTIRYSEDQPINNPPVAYDQLVSTDEGTSVAIILTASDSDGDTLSVTVISGPTNGTLSGTAPDLIYTPNPDYTGGDSFMFMTDDGEADSNIATVTITVNPIDTDPPVPNPMTWATAPSPTGSSSISMTATTASDGNGVEYYFACTAGGCNDSGWQDSMTYDDTGLEPETQYIYQVKARDKSANQNETGWSSTASATTENVGTGQLPVADFSANPLSGEPPLTVTFTDLSTGDPTSWSWDFGDGGTSTMESPTHIYQTADIYTVTLTVTNAQGEDTETKSDYVTISSVNTPPTVTITVPTSGETVSDIITLSAAASDDVGVDMVQFLLDGANLGAEDTSDPYDISWNTTTVPNGTHTISAVATDTSGNTAYAPDVTVEVANEVPSGLVAAFGFNDSDNTPADSSGNGNHGSCTEGLTCPAYVPTGGHLGNGAYNFAGSGNYIEIANEDQFDFTTTFTVSLWMKVNGFANGWEGVATKGDSAWGVSRYQGSRNVTFTTFSPASDDIQGTAIVDDNQWHHVAIVYDGNQKRLYVDGQLDAERTFTDSVSTNNLKVRLGYNEEYPPADYSGLLDDVRIYNRALSQAEIQNDMSSPVAP